MAENYEPGKWDAVVCNGFAAVNVLSSTNVEELGWDYTEMELDPTGTCGLTDAARPGRGGRLPVVPARVVRALERAGHPCQPSR